MRLDGGKLGDGDVVDSVMGENNRYRPSSSLDIKVENGHKQTTPPRKHMHVDNQQLPMRGPALPRIGHGRTRARGSGGIPPKYAEEFLRSQRMEKKYHSARMKHPDHLQRMMEEGVPIKQWLILLALIGAGLYQLRKVLMPTATPDKRKAPKKAPTKKKKDQKNVARASPKKENAPKKENVPPKRASYAQVAASPRSEPKKPVMTEKQVTVQLEKKKPASKKKRTKKASTPKKDETPTTTDDETAELVVEADTIENRDAEGRQQNIHHAESVEDDGWQTVGSTEKMLPKNGGVAHPQAQGSPNKNGSARTPETVSTVASSLERGITVDSTDKIKTEDRAQAETKPPPDLTSAASATLALETDSTGDDEALALKLQQEEEKLANAMASAASNNDVWAEVTSKKARRRSTGAD